jgi:hypothetical protein
MALMIGAHRALAVTPYFLGDFETARQFAARGVEIWRLGRYSAAGRAALPVTRLKASRGSRTESETIGPPER